MSGACRFLSLCKASEVAEGKAIKVEKEGLMWDAGLGCWCVQ